MAWQRASGYCWRALMEADISRLKRVIGDALRSRADRRRATEASIAVKALNRMLELGRPEYVRLVRHTMANGPSRVRPPTHATKSWHSRTRLDTTNAPRPKPA